MPKAKKHPWRKCQPGYHWRSSSHVGAHLRKGDQVRSHYRKGTCVKNPSGQDVMYEDELHRIADLYFPKLKSKISKNNLGSRRGNKFNSLIAGWTQYWNDVFKPKVPLDPDLVKALIMTESSFDPKIKIPAPKGQTAYGLMQIITPTVKYLRGYRKELRNHLLQIDLKDINDPVLNIAGGVRWLFRKKEIASAKIKQKDVKATWLEAIMEYKGRKTLNHREVKDAVENYEKLKSHRK